MGDLNERIRKVRLEKFGERGKSKLCDILDGMPTSTYQLYEEDTKPPGDFLKLFCSKLNINYYWMMEGKGEIDLAMIPIFEDEEEYGGAERRRPNYERRKNRCGPLCPLTK